MAKDETVAGVDRDRALFCEQKAITTSCGGFYSETACDNQVEQNVHRRSCREVKKLLQHRSKRKTVANLLKLH